MFREFLRCSGRTAFITVPLLVVLFFPCTLAAESILTLNDLRSCRRIVSLSVRYSWVEDQAERLFSKHHFVFLEGSYEGYAYCAIKSTQAERVEQIKDLRVPAGVMQAIAIILKESPLRELPQPPAIQDIEGHPYYEISVELCTDGVKFYTYAWDGDYKWAVALANKTYDVGNDAPLSAIKVLEPFMHFEVVERMKEEAFGEPQLVFRKKKAVKLAAKPRTFKNIYFDTAEYKIHPKYDRILFGIVDYLMRNPTASLLVSGHCDERGEATYNLALGEKRASSVISHLINRGVDPTRVRAYSHGENQPAVRGHSEEAWRQNRRVEFNLKDMAAGN